MKKERVHDFSRNEEDAVDLLVRIGTRRVIAQVLVFLANTTRATSHEIEFGTSLRQPQVSLAVKYLTGQGWIEKSGTHSDKDGRSHRYYSLAVPFGEIINAIETAKKDETTKKLALVKKLKDFV